jgi:hypothetical protein
VPGVSAGGGVPRQGTYTPSKMSPSSGSERLITPFKGSPEKEGKTPVTPAGTPHHFLPSTDEGKTHIAEPSFLSNGFGAKQTTLIRATSAWEAANQHNHGTAHIAGQVPVPRAEGNSPRKF